MRQSPWRDDNAHLEISVAPSVATAAITHALQGNGNGIAELQAVFRDRPDLVFRHFPEGSVPWFRWQAGRDVLDEIQLPNGYGVLIERFELLAWSSTEDGLIDKLSC